MMVRPIFPHRLIGFFVIEPPLPGGLGAVFLQNPIANLGQAILAGLQSRGVTLGRGRNNRRPLAEVVIFTEMSALGYLFSTARHQANPPQHDPRQPTRPTTAILCDSTARSARTAVRAKHRSPPSGN